MKCLDLSLPTPESNLACDEALLDLCESGCENEILRFWETTDYFVVAGYANRIQDHVNLEECRARNIPVLRRCTGGGTILQGPGCLNYSLILRIDDSVAFQSITQTNTFIMRAHQNALEHLLRQPVQIQGHTDLTLHQLKFSGNAQRRRRKSLIFHGTFLLDFAISRLDEILPIPDKQPNYRGNRSHRDFLVNLNVAPNILKKLLRETWNADAPLTGVPRDSIDQLVRDKYAAVEWNFRF